MDTITKPILTKEKFAEIVSRKKNEAEKYGIELEVSSLSKIGEEYDDENPKNENNWIFDYAYSIIRKDPYLFMRASLFVDISEMVTLSGEKKNRLITNVCISIFCRKLNKCVVALKESNGFCVTHNISRSGESVFEVESREELYKNQKRESPLARALRLFLSSWLPKERAAKIEANRKRSKFKTLQSSLLKKIGSAEDFFEEILKKACELSGIPRNKFSVEIEIAVRGYCAKIRSKSGATDYFCFNYRSSKDYNRRRFELGVACGLMDLFPDDK